VKRFDANPLLDWLERDRRRSLSEAVIGTTEGRRVRRWRDGETTTLQEADMLLTAVDVHLDEVPQELLPDTKLVPTTPDLGGVPKGYGAKLNDDKIRLLHRFHVERRVTVQALAKSIWESSGFASSESASWSIRQGFRRLDLPVIHHRARAADARRCKEPNHRGEPCGSYPLQGLDVCWSHHPDNREAAREAALRNSPWAEVTA
jgi:hypothetical protein